MEEDEELWWGSSIDSEFYLSDGSSSFVVEDSMLNPESSVVCFVINLNFVLLKLKYSNRF